MQRSIDNYHPTEKAKNSKNDYKNLKNINLKILAPVLKCKQKMLIMKFQAFVDHN